MGFPKNLVFRESERSLTIEKVPENCHEIEKYEILLIQCASFNSFRRALKPALQQLRVGQAHCPPSQLTKADMSALLKESNEAHCSLGTCALVPVIDLIRSVGTVQYLNLNCSL